jgi:pimeloyl-ACP methyl ester carboxylesterase
MAADSRTSGLDRIQQELARRDVAGLRAAILGLSDAEEQLFAAEVGPELLERTRSSARRVRRGGKRGYVVVVHGIMGSMLDVVQPSGDTDRVWVNMPRLILGRIADLELGPDEQSVKPGYHVRTAGLHRKTYVPLLLELDQEWEVRPFAFDWREDIERSAERLAGEIRAWAPDKPVHLVAHSMGGLVSRCMIRLHPELWSAMEDLSGAGAGGRLVMLGTPNQGSYSIPLALCGQEKLVKALEICDLRHDLPAVLRILSSFPGSYQMLPSPLVDLGDQHDRLYDAASWGKLPVQAALLQKAERFHTQLRDVVNPERLVYVAGYDRETPFLIKVDGPGEFSFQTTLEGDGRVPHALGLLPGVPTFWVDESHGDLPRNERVLDGIHDLLARGQTDALDRIKPARRGPARAAAWRSAKEIDAVPAEVATLVPRAKRGRRGAEPILGDAQAIALEGWVLGDYLGGPRLTSRGVKVDASAGRGERGAAPAPQPAAVPELNVEVVWGDMKQVEGDVYTVGHYQGVRPQRAELALDKAVSGDSDRLVITEHSRRGTLRGALGDVDYFPWGDPRHRGRVVAVAGLGRPGSFNLAALRRLIRELVLSVSLLPNAETVCSVLIGSGEGTLSIHDAVQGLADGIAEALSTTTITTGIRKLRVVELERSRAHEILAELKCVAESESLAPRIHLRIAGDVIRAPGGRVSNEALLQEVLAVSARAAKAPSGAKTRAAVETILEGITDAKLRNQTRRALENLEDRVRVSYGRAESSSQQVPARVSVLEESGVIRMAAITETATVAERTVSVDPKLIDEVVATVNDPDTEPMPHFGTFLLRLVVPREFRPLLAQESRFVFEVDRTTAKIHWEMLARDVAAPPEAEPLGVQVEVARQLRTTYSPPPIEARRREGPLRALIVGDPGDPTEGHNLPGARDEALRVREILLGHRVEVTALIGAPTSSRRGLPRGVAAATRVEVLSQLMHGRWDILHYCGHGDFDPSDPTRVGWVFAGGLLTAREIERLDEVPALIVANACLSGRTSQALEGGRRVERDRSETGLLPSLADEFFRLGVRNYVGTAWAVNDVGAVEFAKAFYETLLATDGVKPTVGEAMRVGRQALYARSRSFGKLWAAYQHYGDPVAKLV